LSPVLRGVVPPIDPPVHPDVNYELDREVISFKCLLSNIRSLKCKISELNLVITGLGIDLVCLCETWLGDSTLDSMIIGKEFCVFRKDRTIRKGGGVCVICRNDLRYICKRVVLPPRFSCLEMVAVDILIGIDNGIRLVVVYCPPDLINDFNICKLLVSAFMYLGNTSLTFCIVGDFNLPLMDWVNNSSPNHKVYIELLSYFQSNSLEQLVSFPTRDNNLLDIILSDNPSQFRNIAPMAPIGSSDHVTILFDLVLETELVNNFRLSQVLIKI
jgi:hypothetical protein